MVQKLSLSESYNIITEVYVAERAPVLLEQQVGFGNLQNTMESHHVHVPMHTTF